MSCMCGASIATLSDNCIAPGRRLVAVFAAACAALVISAAVCNLAMLRLCFAAFCIFELCVGVYFPSVGVLKSSIVPERVRGTIYNLYRVPLNGVVVAALLTNMSIAQVYTFCAVLLGVGAGSSAIVHYITPPAKADLPDLKGV
mmetsp:Transcript_17460/g.54937  ORF Transcript_17460/g.54937 Transcript_17460/m.54937 type:complete len:144 (+) Transcript_17460:1-432(+)